VRTLSWVKPIGKGKKVGGRARIPGQGHRGVGLARSFVKSELLPNHPTAVLRAFLWCQKTILTPSAQLEQHGGGE
jgi:hypothetical protein